MAWHGVIWPSADDGRVAFGFAVDRHSHAFKRFRWPPALGLGLGQMATSIQQQNTNPNPNPHPDPHPDPHPNPNPNPNRNPNPNPNRDALCTAYLPTMILSPT